MKWRVLMSDLRKGFKVKTSSEPFKAAGHEFCLDVFLDGWGDDEKDWMAVYVRYVGRSKKILARVSVSLANGPTWKAEGAWRPRLFFFDRVSFSRRSVDVEARVASRRVGRLSAAGRGVLSVGLSVFLSFVRFVWLWSGGDAEKVSPAVP